MQEINAKGTVGFLMRSPKDDVYFRVYENGKFTDYELMCEELEVEIKSDYFSFYIKDNMSFLDFSSIAKK